MTGSKTIPSHAPIIVTSSRWRVVAIRLWAGLLTLWALAMAQGVVILGSAASSERFMYATSSVWKLLSLGAVAVIWWTAGRSTAAYWAVALGQLTWIVAGVLVPQPDANGPLLTVASLAILYGPLVLLHPRRRALLKPEFRPDGLTVAVALAGGVPAVARALQVRHQVSGEIGMDVVGLYLVLAAAALLTSLNPSRPRWLWSSASLGIGLTGIAALIRPDDVASPGRVGGLLLIIWGVALAAVSLSRLKSSSGSGEHASKDPRPRTFDP